MAATCGLEHHVILPSRRQASCLQVLADELSLGMRL
jgi:hypothetical protein